MTTTSRQHSVLVVGHMNPAIHHPAWYKAAGILTDEEAESATSGANDEFATLQGLAQFTYGRTRVQCVPERWMAFSAEDDGRSIVLKLAEDTFGRLGDTPIVAFGTSLVLEADVGQMCASSLVQKLALKSLAEEFSMNQFSCGRALSDFEYEARRASRGMLVSVALREARVQVNVQVQHSLEESNESSGAGFPALLGAAAADIGKTIESTADEVLAQLREGEC